MRPGLLLIVGLMLAPLLASGTAFAQGVQPLDHLLPQIQRNHPGQFFGADGPTTNPDGSQHYHLKWMTPDGRILWFDADARTGRVLGLSPGHDAFDRRDGPPEPPRNIYPYPGGNYFGRGYAGPGGYSRDYGAQDNRGNPPYGGPVGRPSAGNRAFGRGRGRNGR
jgi:hypothetical protein